jgi:aryl-alcohol dehydrogenase-like predicted oxidoreductase
MQRRKLGRTGLEVSRIGFGCGGTAGLMTSRGNPADQRAIVQRALEAGIDYFDTSPLYGEGHSETNLGRVLQELGAHPVVSTKWEITAQDIDALEKAVTRSIERSLDRFRRDSIDILFLHNRVGRVRDIGGRVLSVNDVLGSGGVAAIMEGLRDRGLVRSIGYTGLGHTDAVLSVLRSGRFDLVQAYYNFINPSAAMMVPAAWRAQDFEDLIGIANSMDVGVVGIRALAVGALTDRGGLHHLAKPYSSLSRAEVEGDRVLAESFRPHMPENYPMAKFAIRYALSQKNIDTVLIGISEDGQLGDVVAAEAEGDLPPSTIEAMTARFRELYETA